MDIEALKNYLIDKAKKNACLDDDDFIPYDYCGGNYDDAFDQGQSDGEIIFAREILFKFFPEVQY